MWNIVDQAKLAYEGQDDFLHWLYGLVGACSVPVLDYYSTGTVFHDLFGFSHRIYQIWEKRVDFPVKDPERLRLPVVNVVGRAYTPAQVAQIAYWVWQRYRENYQEQKGGEVNESSIA